MSDYLIHWGLSLGQKAKNHKYIARKQLGTKNGQNIYRYFYSQAEIAAYKAGKTVGDAASNVANKTAKAAVKFEKNAGKTLAKAKNTAERAVNNTAKSAIKIEKNAEKEASKVVNKVGKTADKIKEETTKIEKRANATLKQTEDKIKDKTSQIRNKINKTSEEVANSATKNATKIKDLITNNSSKKVSDLLSTKSSSNKSQKGAIPAALAYVAAGVAIGVAKVAIKELIYHGPEIVSAAAEAFNNTKKKINEVANKVLPETVKDKLNIKEEKHDGPIDETTGLRLKNKEYSKEEDQEQVNPNYSPYNAQYSHNCADCTATWDMRQRGYDVEAIGNSSGEPDSEIESWYVNGHFENDADGYREASANGKIKTYDDYTNYFNDKLSQYGDGAYGHLGITWITGGGHDVIWSNENGKTMIRDCQTNKTMEYKEWLIAYKDYIADLEHMRTDNLEITDKIKHACKSK